MAQVYAEQEHTVPTWVPWARVLLIGAGLGLVFWLLTLLLNRYVIEPLVCRDVTQAALCVNSASISGNIATIFTALVGVFVLLRVGIPRPIIIGVASGALLWSLAGLSLGLFWVESLVWSIVLYAATYLLFTWIARYTNLWVVITISVLIILIIRIALIL